MSKQKKEKKEQPAAEAKAARNSTRKAKEEGLCVFALRMTEAERTKLHEAAGPGGATRLARAVLVAAANEGEGAFRATIKEARTRDSGSHQPPEPARGWRRSRVVLL